MLIRNVYDIIISLMNENIYSMQLNLALIPQDDTVESFGVVANVLQLAILRFISNFFRV